MTIEQEITKFLEDAGALKVGFTNQEKLKDGPPSTVLSTYMADAKSAIVFAVPMDREIARSYLAKDNINARSNHEKDNYRTLIKSFILGLDVKDILESKGFKAEAVFPNFEYKSYDVKGLFKPFPIISLRYLAAMSGVGSLGWSGNLGIKDFGPAITLGGIVTSAELKPTPPLPESESFCVMCKICTQVCAFRMFSVKEEEVVTIGDRKLTYSKRLDKLRCENICGGYNGLDKKGKWSTWASGRAKYPETDEESINSFAKSFRFDPGVLVDGEDGGIDSKEFAEDPRMVEYFKENQIVLSQVSNIKLTCGNCQLVCRGNNLNETKENLKLLKESGMVIRKENGKTQILKGEEINNAEKLHHLTEVNDKEKKACEIIKKAFTEDKPFNFDFFPSP